MRIALALFCGFTFVLSAQSLVVLNKESATLVVVDAKTGKVSKPVPTGESPHEVEVSADGSTAFVTNYGGRNPGHTLSVIDLRGLVEKHRVDLSPLSKPHGIAVADGKVWFTAEANKVVGRYDPASNRVDSVIGTGQNGTHMVMFDKTRKHMITANIAGDSVSIFTLEANNNWNQVLVPVGKGPEGLDVSPDGSQVWVAHSRDGGVSVIDLASKKVTAGFDAATKRSNRIKLTEDGKHALISDLSGNELVIVDAASKKVVKRMPIGKSPEGILIEPGGARAFIAVTGQNEIAVLDLKTLEVTTRFQPGAGPDGMAWIATK